MLLQTVSRTMMGVETTVRTVVAVVYRFSQRLGSSINSFTLHLVQKQW